ANMSGNNTTGAFQGFSVVQPSLGAALQWFPALGTQELDGMINAFLPGPSSIQDKRAQIAIDFFEYSQLTGESFKFYPVLAATSSPASSAAVYDSGYASNFNVSPVITESQWVDSPSTFTAISFDEGSVRSPSSSSTSKRTGASSSRQQPNDFANHPGMRIMTKDGRDVTSSASRGCKTKEQRDHAHLMRIIKACDSCRKKKIRCDPSHRKKGASPAAAAPAEKKSSRKSSSKKKAATAAEAPPPSSINEFSLDFLNDESFDASQLTFPTFETTTDHLDELWNQYVQDPTLFTNDFTNYVPDDFLFTDHQLSQVSPYSGSTATSPSQVYTPYTPTPPGRSPPTVVYGAAPEVSQSDPTLPYLNPGVPHGTDYVDFNLFSPPRDFVLDEEPQSVKKRSASGRQQRSSAQQISPVSSYVAVDNIATTDYPDGLQTGGLARSESPGSQQSFSPGLIGQSGVNAQSNVRASVRHATGYNTASGIVPNAPSVVVSLSSAPVSTPIAATSIESPYAFVNSPRAGLAVPSAASLPVDAQATRRRAVDSRVPLVETGGSVTMTVSSQDGSSGSGQLVQSQSGVQQRGIVPSGVDVGTSLNALVATTLSTSPVRRLPAGVSAKSGHVSSPSSLVYTQLVVLGLVSYLLVCLVGTQFMGRLVNTLVSLTTVSLTVLMTSSSSDVTQPSALVAENVKSRVQATGCKVHRHQASLFSRLASAHSLTAMI
ncbi:hypothetical protein V8F06_011460, partial [Rhypophila decipiens]